MTTKNNGSLQSNSRGHRLGSSGLIPFLNIEMELIKSVRGERYYVRVTGPLKKESLVFSILYGKSDVKTRDSQALSSSCGALGDYGST
jgi:hypothetical protein